MKKVILLSSVILGTIFLSGCSQQPVGISPLPSPSPSPPIVNVPPQQPTSPPSDFESQSKCAEMSATLAKEIPHTSYSNKYSTDKGKCFIEIERLKKNNKIDGYDYSAFVMDPSAGPGGIRYAEFEMHIADELKLGVPDICALKPKVCEAVSRCYVANLSCSENPGNDAEYFHFNRLVSKYFGIK